MSLDVRVGIVSYETATELRACLQALPAALGGLRAEVVVVDNASTDDSREVAAAAPGVRLVAGTDNVGYARAMNVALAGSGEPAYALVALNPDAVPPPGSLARLVQVLREQPDVGLVVPRLANADGSLQHSVHRFPSVRLALLMGLLPHALRRGPLGRRAWLEGFAAHDRPADVDWAIGAVHVIRSAAVSREHPYSERWFMYVEDMEICWRMRQDGWRVRLEPAVEVVHVGNVAGAKVWGGVAREERWIDALYDWYAATHGRAAASGYALTTCLSLLVKAAVLLAARGDRERLVRVRALLGIHARRVLDPRSTGLSHTAPGTPQPSRQGRPAA